MDYSLYPILYTFLYIISYILLIKAGKKARIGRIILIIYALASASSIYFYNNSSYAGSHLKLIPYLYLFLTTFICILPFVNTKRLDSVPLRFSGNSGKLLDFLSLVLGIFACWWFVELFFIGTEGITSIDFDANYGGEDYTGKRISWLGRKFKLVSIYTLDLIYFLFFYQLSKRKNKILTALLAFGTLASPFDALMGGKRFIMVLSLVRYLVFYLLFEQLLNHTTKRIMKWAGMIVIGIAAFGLVLITLSRFDNDKSMNIDVMTWVTLYSGEGPLRFNLQAWDMKCHTQGDNTFTLVKDMLGMNPPIELEDRERFWGGRHGLMYGVYYTFIGDVFFDFGVFGTLLFVLLFCVICKLLIGTYKGKPGSILLIAMMLQFVMFGITYNPYINYGSQVSLLISTLFAIWLNFSSSGIKK